MEGEVSRSRGFTRAVTNAQGRGSGESGPGGRRPVTKAGGKKREAKKKEQRGIRKRIAESVTRKVYHMRVVVTGREKRGRIRRTYKSCVISTSSVGIPSTYNR